MGGSIIQNVLLFIVIVCISACPSMLLVVNGFFIGQDPANQNGGKWMVRFKKAVSGRFWEDLVSELVISLYVF